MLTVVLLNCQSLLFLVDGDPLSEEEIFIGYKLFLVAQSHSCTSQSQTALGQSHNRLTGVPRHINRGVATPLSS